MWKIVLVLGVLSHLGFGLDITNTPTSDVGVAKTPTWSDDAQCLYYVNFFPQGNESSLFRYCPKDKSFNGAYIEGKNLPSFIIPLSKKCEDLYAVGIGHDIVKVHWDGKSNKATIIDKLTTVEADDPKSRLDIAKADPEGRIYFGTFSTDLCGTKTPTAGFYVYSEKDGLKKFPNGHPTGGLAFNEDEKILYQLDPCGAVIRAFDWDVKTGDIRNERIVFDIKSTGAHDALDPVVGLENDKNDLLYVPLYSGSILVIDPRSSKLVNKIKLPGKGVAGAAFGGKSRDILYTTVGKTILNIQNGSVLEQISHGTSVYAVNGLKATGHKSTHLKYKNCSSANIIEKILKKIKS